MPQSLARPPRASSQEDLIYVFGSDISGRHAQETAGIAVRLYGAEVGKGSGLTSRAYAIPCRNSDQQTLALSVIENYRDSFYRYAEAHPGTLFRIGRFACESDSYQDTDMARLFAKAPQNCQLPGVWLRTLDANRPARLLLFDPEKHLEAEAWGARLKQFITEHLAQWQASSVELVSVGEPQSIVANDRIAKQLKLKHRIIGTNLERDGRNAVFAAEHRAVWYSTHLISILDFDRTARLQQSRITTSAIKAGLTVEQIDSSKF